MRSAADILYNFHWVVPGQAARAAQAWAGFLGPFLERRGIRAVVNLRGPNPDWRWWHRERRTCSARGIAHCDAMLSSKNLPSRAMLMALIAAFDALPRPLLLKCSGGQDRTSFAAALYLLHARGWSGFEAAAAQFARWPYLHLPKPHQRWLRLFLDYAREQAQGRPLAGWIAQDYRAAQFQAWLEGHGQGRSFKSAYLAQDAGQ